MRDAIPLVFADGTVEDWPASTRVRCDRPRRAGLGRKPRDDGSTTLRALGREVRGGAEVTLPDGRTAHVEGWAEQVARLQADLAQARADVEALRAEVAPTWAKALVAVEP